MTTHWPRHCFHHDGRAYIRSTLAKRQNRLPRTFQLQSDNLDNGTFSVVAGTFGTSRQKENDSKEDEVAVIDLKDNLIARSEIFIFSDENGEEEEEMLEDAKKGEVSD